MLKGGSAGLGLMIAAAACGSGDVDVFAGALTDPVGEGSAGAAAQPVPTTAPIEIPEEIAQGAPPTVEASPTTVDASPTAAPDPTAEPAAEPTTPPATAEPTAAPTAPPNAGPVAVAGEMVVSFTYTPGPVGKIERPYIAVWVENQAGELAETISLWYEQGRRGARWLDHLDRWWAVDQSRIALGGVDDSVTISSATRAAGSYTVVWDGNIDGVPAPAGQYFVCIESAREDGPTSLIREPFNLGGTLASTALPNAGELSAASVRIDV